HLLELVKIVILNNNLYRQSSPPIDGDGLFLNDENTSLGKTAEVPVNHVYNFLLGPVSLSRIHQGKSDKSGIYRTRTGKAGSRNGQVACVFRNRVHNKLRKPVDILI